MGIYLAYKEVWRNRGRFFLFSMVISLITVLVLFIAGLAEGLASANKEYLSKLDAELIVFQSNVDTSIAASRLGRSKVNDIRRVQGVETLGAVGFSSGALVFPDRPNLNVSLVGVDPGRPGEPLVEQGTNLQRARGKEVVIDSNLAQRAGVGLGDTIEVKTIQGTEEKLYQLQVAGITSGQQYLFAPSIFLPFETWDTIRPTAGPDTGEAISNVVVVKVAPGYDAAAVGAEIGRRVTDVEVTDIQTAIQNLPGYSAQQSTLNTQQAFTLLIGVLVVGGFFQIQLLQKVPQIGVLKAIGASNQTVGVAVVTQIVLVTTFGVLLGGLLTAGLAFGMPSNVPVRFTGEAVALAVGLLLAIGPLGGLVSVLRAVTVEPLLALGLSQ